MWVVLSRNDRGRALSRRAKKQIARVQCRPSGGSARVTAPALSNNRTRASASVPHPLHRACLAHCLVCSTVSASCRARPRRAPRSARHATRAERKPWPRNAKQVTGEERRSKHQSAARLSEKRTTRKAKATTRNGKTASTEKPNRANSIRKRTN